MDLGKWYGISWSMKASEMVLEVSSKGFRSQLFLTLNPLEIGANRVNFASAPVKHQFCHVFERPVVFSRLTGSRFPCTELLTSC